MKTVDDYNFKDDVKDGEKGETIIADFLITKGYKLISDNKDNKFDLRMLEPDGRETTIEIKTDVLCTPERDTGNMFIEKHSRGKDSGIAVSQAEWFVMYYPYLNESYFIKTETLRNLVKDTYFYVATGGDPGSNTKGYLVNKKKYGKKFNKIQIDHKWEK